MPALRRRQHLAGRRPTGPAVVVRLIIEDGWAASGWENGPLGWPVREAGGNSPAGRTQEFEGGFVYWSADHRFPRRERARPGSRDVWAARGQGTGPPPRLPRHRRGLRPARRRLLRPLPGGLRLLLNPGSGPHVINGAIPRRLGPRRLGARPHRLPHHRRGLRPARGRLLPALRTRLRSTRRPPPERAPSSGDIRDPLGPRPGWENVFFGYPTTDTGLRTARGRLLPGTSSVGSVYQSARPTVPTHVSGVVRDNLAQARAGRTARWATPPQASEKRVWGTTAVSRPSSAAPWQLVDLATGAQITTGAIRDRLGTLGLGERPRCGYPTSAATMRPPRRRLRPGLPGRQRPLVPGHRRADHQRRDPRRLGTAGLGERTAGLPHRRRDRVRRCRPADLPGRQHHRRPAHRARHRSLRSTAGGWDEVRLQDDSTASSTPATTRATPMRVLGRFFFPEDATTCTLSRSFSIWGLSWTVPSRLPRRRCAFADRGNGCRPGAPTRRTGRAAGQAPVAVDDAVNLRNMAAGQQVHALGNDSDPDGDVLTYTAVTQGTKGTAYIDTSWPHYLKYRPNTGAAAGTDSFTYTVSDGNGNTATGTVTVTLWDEIPSPSDFVIQEAGPDAVALTWSAVPGATAYRVHQNGGGIITTTNLTRTVTGLSELNTHSWFVGAVNGGGFESLFMPSVSREIRTATPSGLTVRITGDPTTLALDWDGTGTGPWNVYRDGALVGSSAASEFQDTGLVTGRQYSYQVQHAARSTPTVLYPTSLLSAAVLGTPAVMPSAIAQLVLDRDLISALGPVTVPERAIPGGTPAGPPGRTGPPAGRRESPGGHRTPRHRLPGARTAPRVTSGSPSPTRRAGCGTAGSASSSRAAASGPRTTRRPRPCTGSSRTAGPRTAGRRAPWATRPTTWWSCPAGSRSPSRTAVCTGATPPDPTRSAGYLHDAYVARGSTTSFLGYPAIGDDVCGLRNGGCRTGLPERQHPLVAHDRGRRSPRAASATRGRAREWENGYLGYPTTGTTCGLRNGGCGQAFQGGSIHWSPTTGGADHHRRHPHRLGPLRPGRTATWATPPPAPSAASATAAAGRPFQGGHIHWSPATGAQITTGAHPRRLGPVGLGERTPRLPHHRPPSAGCATAAAARHSRAAASTGPRRPGHQITTGAHPRRLGTAGLGELPGWATPPAARPCSGGVARQTFQGGSITRRPAHRTGHPFADGCRR